MEPKKNIERFVVPGERLVVQRLAARDKTDGGIYLPDGAKRRPQLARVVKTYEGALVTPGDLVVYSPFAGTPFVDIDGQEYLILDYEDILMYEPKGA